jgi:Zn-dependent M32 family carboxypeptidase
MMETLVSGLPVIVLENWTLLADQKKMEKLWERARANDQFDKLKLTFWLDKLINIDKNV